VLAGLLAAAATGVIAGPAAAAVVVEFPSWQDRTDVLPFTVSADVAPAGWSPQPVPAESTTNLVRGDATITFRLNLSGTPLLAAGDARVDAQQYRDFLANQTGNDGAFGVVALPGGAWAATRVATAGSPERVLYVARRSRPDTEITAQLIVFVNNTVAFPSEAAIAEADAALRQIGPSLDGFLGPDILPGDQVNNAAGLAALGEAFKKSRGRLRYSHYQQIIRTGRSWLGGAPLPPRAKGLSSAILLDVPRKLQANIVDGRVRNAIVGRRFSTYVASLRCYQTGTGTFPANVRFFGSLLHDKTLDVGSTTPAVRAFLTPATLAANYGLVFKPKRVVGGKVRIEYLMVDYLYRWRVAIRLNAAGRIEAIHRERLDRDGAAVSVSTSRITYSVNPAAIRTGPACR
jgi:hypothetical protein